MRLLLTWSDRGAAGPRPRHHGMRPADDAGPVMHLARQADAGPWDAAMVLTTPDGVTPAQGLLAELRAVLPSASLRSLPVDDPSDHAQLFTALGPLLEELPRRVDLDIVLSAGTPQAQTLWVILAAAGLLAREHGRVRLLQVIPSAFVPSRHPRPWREVSLDIEGFPEVRALRAELRRLRAEAQVQDSALVGDSAPMVTLKRQLARVAPSEVPVLILGETGTGKELLARAIHQSSSRAAGPFVAESCAALAEGVLASELFGHEPGAFTGASKRHRGLFEMAHGGTLLLDEVAELSPRVQAMLLRVLQEGELRRVGGEAPVKVDVRLIAATHRDLPSMVREGSFREDLYYRLCGATLTVPPLRERISDLEPLVARFFAELRRGQLRLDPAAWAMLRGYRWPGNVRELRAEVVRWTVFCDGLVRVQDLNEAIRGGSSAPQPAPGAPDLRPLAVQVAELERRAVSDALRAAQGNKSAAARQLDVDRNTLKRKMQELGIPDA